MVRESLVSAVGAGFGVVRRDFGSVLIWGLIAIGLALLPVLILIPAMGATALGARLDGDFDPNALGGFMAGQAITNLMSLVTGILSASIITPAIYRAVLLPRSERGFAYLRFGKTEFYMGVFHVVMFVIFVVGALIAFLLAALLIGLPFGGVIAMLAGGGSPDAAAGAAVGLVLLLIPVSIGFVLGMLYLLGRVWPGSAMIVAEQELRIFDGWALTRGLGWRLVGMQIVLFLMGFALFIGIVVVVAICAAIFGVSVGAMFSGLDGPSALAAAPLVIVFGILAIGLYFVVISVMQTIFLAPWAKVYQIIARETGRAESSVFS